jgi:NADH:ubiquinone oxidoreductase 20 kD subunit and related Fe-S oxidoreductases
MAVDKPLRDLGLQSERLLMPKPASHFEEEVQNLEQKVGLTTLAKAVAWAQTNSMWPDTFGLACCAIEMMSIVRAATTSHASGWSRSAARRARPTC